MQSVAPVGFLSGLTASSSAQRDSQSSFTLTPCQKLDGTRVLGGRPVSSQVRDNPFQDPPSCRGCEADSTLLCSLVHPPDLIRLSSMVPTVAFTSHFLESCGLT